MMTTTNNKKEEKKSGNLLIGCLYSTSLIIDDSRWCLNEQMNGWRLIDEADSCENMLWMALLCIDISMMFLYILGGSMKAAASTTWVAHLFGRGRDDIQRLREYRFAARKSNRSGNDDSINAGALAIVHAKNVCQRSGGQTAATSTAAAAAAATAAAATAATVVGLD